MEPYKLYPFVGLRSSVANPNGVGSQAGKNFVRNRIAGYLDQSPGYANKFSSSPVPTVDTLRHISALSIVDVGSFTVPDHSGQSITIVLANYTKTSHGYTPADTLNTFGIWIRPYWNGSAWIDDWKELTEFYMLKGSAFGASDITLDNTLVEDLSFLDANAAANFSMLFGSYADTGTNLELVTASQAAAPQLTIFGATASWSGRTATDKFYLFRTVFNKLLPASLAPQIHGLLTEARLTTGPSLSDITAAIYFKTKTFSFSKNNTPDAIFAEPACFDFPLTTWTLAERAKVAVATDPLPAGLYDLKSSLVMDDGSEAELRDSIGTVTATIAKVGTTNPTGFVVEPFVTCYLDGIIYGINATTAKILKYSVEQNLVTDSGYVHDAIDGTMTGIFTDGTYLYLTCANGSGTYDRPCVVKITAGPPCVKVTSLTYTATMGGPAKSVLSDGKLYCIIGTGGGSWVQVVNLDTMSWGSATEIVGCLVSGSNAWADAANIYWPADTHAVADAIAYNKATAVITYIIVYGFTGYGFLVFTKGTQIYIGSSDGYIHNMTIGTWVPSLWHTQLNTWPYGVSLSAEGYFCIAFLTSNSTTSYFKVLDDAGTVLFHEDYTYSATIKHSITVGYLVYGGLGTTAFDIFSVDLRATMDLNGKQTLTFKPYVSPGLIPRRAAKIRVYMQKDGAGFYKVVDIDLLTQVFEASYQYETTTKHDYNRANAPTTITLTEWTAATDPAEANLQRAITSQGILNYSFGLVSNRRSFAVGARGSLRQFINQVVTSIQHGSGVPQYDVFPDGTNVLDVEYSDGDDSIGLGVVGQSILVLKRRSLVLLMDDGVGGFNRVLVTRGVGCASALSVVSYDDKVYWLDYSGFHRYSTSGLVFIGQPIRDEIQQLARATLEGAVAALDRDAKCYRCLVGSTMYCFDLAEEADGRTEWMPEVYADTPGRFAVDTSDGGVVFISAGKLLKVGAGSRHAGTNFTMEYESTDVSPADQEDADYLIHRFMMSYKSDVNVRMALHLDANGTPVQTAVFPAGDKVNAFQSALLGLRGKRIHVKISATTTADNQKVRIRKAGVLFTLQPSGPETGSL